MVFSSTIFLFAFLPCVLVGYYLIRKELRNAFLLIMSLLFYAVGEPRFVFIMMLSIVVNYLLAILIDRQKDKRFVKRILLVAVVAVNIGILFYYKYFDFAITNVNHLFGMDLPLKHIVLPIGISFFTFQGMSYVLDVYMGKVAVQKNPLYVALYVSFFPQLIAGPIVRYTDVEREIGCRSENIEAFASGITRFAVGLAKKVIISNNVALLADQAFGYPVGELSAGMASLGAIAYSLQIYFDFSGYSDMAIGLGRMFGFHFNENFHYPYISLSVTEFWRRWHISLSTWFRDYIYIPLGGNRKGNVYLHLFVVFLLTGIWHGASWNFVVWGLWHGFFLIVERIFKKNNLRLRVPKAVSWLYTMVVVTIGWIMFRASDMDNAMAYLAALVNFKGVEINTLLYACQDYGLILILGCVASIPIIPKLKQRFGAAASGKRVLDICEPVCVGFLLAAGIAFTVASTYNPFIYFNF